MQTEKARSEIMPDDLFREPPEFRRRPPAQRSNNVLLIFAVAIVSALSGAFVAVKVLDEREQPPPQSAPQPVIVVKPPPAQPTAGPLKDDETARLRARIAELEQSAREARERSAAAIAKRRSAADSIPGNAVPRKQFHDDVMGKTGEQVIELYGKPDRSLQSTDSPAIWVYNRRTYDPAVGKPDISAVLWFNADGQVYRVGF